MNYEEWDQGVADAQATLKRADSAADTFARLLKGRLRKVNAWVLADLKRELKDFNCQRKTWKK
jgi:hypothetical protein